MQWPKKFAKPTCVLNSLCKLAQWAPVLLWSFLSFSFSTFCLLFYNLTFFYILHGLLGFHVLWLPFAMMIIWLNLGVIFWILNMPFSLLEHWRMIVFSIVNASQWTLVLNICAFSLRAGFSSNLKNSILICRKWGTISSYSSYWRMWQRRPR